MASDEISTLLEKLHLSSENNEDINGQQFEKLIDDIHKQDDKNALCEALIQGKILSIVIKALENSNSEVQTKAAELVAELAKVESCRLSCVEEAVVPVLVEKMASEETSTALQACRALGNICYEYDGGRMCVMNSGGVQQLLNLLKRAVDLPNTPENHQLRLVSTGFLLNLLNSYSTTEQEHPLDCLLVEVLCQYLSKFAVEEDVPTHILLALTCMVDSDLSRGLVVSRDITPHLVNVLNLNESAEVIETCLELITNLAETDCVKTQLAVGGVCQAVIGVINRHTENPSPDVSPPIIKTATDLLVMILVGDESMNVVYRNGEGPDYKELVSWLSSSSEELQYAGSLAMGNFARNDSHCTQMVQSGIAEKLLQVLSRHNTPEGDIRLQHALLSALRNLSIAKQNKPLIVKQGALDTLLPMVLSIETYPVVFKLLGTLRMIIDGQPDVALRIGENENSVRRIGLWCNTLEHPGVQGEAVRTLAWIIINCKGSDTVVECLMNVGAHFSLFSMLTSEHIVMINEAALSIALLFGKGKTAGLVETLKETPFIQTIVVILRNQALPPEVRFNVLGVLVALSSAEEFGKLDKSGDLKMILESYSSYPGEDIDFKSYANKVLEVLEG